MQMFLMIVGGFLVAMALFVLLVFLWIRAKFRQFARSIGERLQELADSTQNLIPPARIHLERSDEMEFDHAEAIEALARPLREIGFETVGRFDTSVHGSLRLLALTYPQESIYAAIYEKEPVGVWMDLVTRYTDGTSFTCSNAKLSGMKHPPGKAVEKLPEADALTLYRRFLERRPQAAAVPASSEKFVEVFEQSYAEDMDWQLERGGPTDEEIRAIMGPQETSSSPEVAAKTIAMVRQTWQARGHQHLVDRLRENFLNHMEIPVAQWEEIRDRLVFVHDRMDAETLMSHFEDRLEEASEDPNEVEDAARELASHQQSRQAFARVNQLLPTKSRFEKFGAVSQPVEADVYLAPQECDD